jgi:hypothetical protein
MQPNCVLQRTPGTFRVSFNLRGPAPLNTALGPMRVLFAAMALSFLLPSSGFACSLAMSPEFHFRTVKHAAAPPPRIKVEKVTFVPWINHSGSCDGVGFIVIHLSGRPHREAQSYGFLVRAVSGVNDSALFPTYPLAAEPPTNGMLSIAWGWTGITPDPDGHVRWRLEVIPISRWGVQGAPVFVCAASDGSCPKLSGSG